ncbi:MAG: cytochrome c maturation protein CcmE [Byssovorax sp.]
MSKKLDQELADAIEPQADEAPSSAPGVVKGAEPAARPASRSPRNLALLVTLLVMVGSVITLFLVGFKEAAVYATGVDTIAKAKGDYVGRKVRVEGELVPGTLVKRDQPCEYRFTVHGKEGDNKLPVRYAQCVIPDTFRDVPQGGVQVTVEGTLTKEGEFQASLVMAKCASKYDPSTHTMSDGKGAPGAMPVN